MANLEPVGKGSLQACQVVRTHLASFLAAEVGDRARSPSMTVMTPLLPAAETVSTGLFNGRSNGWSARLCGLRRRY